MSAKAKTGISDWLRSNVLGLVAIFMILSGTAYANHPGGADTIDSADIINNSVVAADVRNDSLAGGGLVEADLRPDSVSASEVIDGSVTGAEVDEGSLDATVLQRRVSGNCPSGQAIREVAEDGAVTCEDVGGGGSPTGPASGDLTGFYPNPTIATGAVNSAKVTDNSLTAADVADTSTLGGSEINEGLLTLGGDLTGNVASAQIGSSAVGAAEIADGTVGAAEIGTAAVGGQEIATNAVGATDIGADAVGGSEIITGGVASAEVVDQSLVAGDIANNNSLGDAEISQESLNVAVGKSGLTTTTCDDNDHNGSICASTTFTLSRTQHIMVIATGRWNVDSFSDSTQDDADVGQAFGDNGNIAHMTCDLRADNSVFSSGVGFGEKQVGFGNTPASDQSQEQGVGSIYSQTGVTPALTAGDHTLAVRCTDGDGDMSMRDTRITAVALD